MYFSGVAVILYLGNDHARRCSSRTLKDLFSARLLKKVQMQGGVPGTPRVAESRKAAGRQDRISNIELRMSNVEVGGLENSRDSGVKEQAAGRWQRAGNKQEGVRQFGGSNVRLFGELGEAGRGQTRSKFEYRIANFECRS